MALNGRPIELHIEELVLHGFAPGDRMAIAAAIEGEVGRLLVENGLPAGIREGGSIQYLDAPSLVAGPTTTPHALGERIGRSLYQALGGETR